WFRRAGSCKLHAGIRGDDICDSRGHQPYASVIVVLSEERDCLAAEPSDLAIRKDGFESVADLGPVFVVLDRNEDEDATIRSLAANTPLFEQIDCVAVDVTAIQATNCYYRNLCMGFVIDLLA